MRCHAAPSPLLIQKAVFLQKADSGPGEAPCFIVMSLSGSVPDTELPEPGRSQALRGRAVSSVQAGRAGHALVVGTPGWAQVSPVSVCVWSWRPQAGHRSPLCLCVSGCGDHRLGAGLPCLSVSGRVDLGVDAGLDCHSVCLAVWSLDISRGHLCSLCVPALVRF